MLKSFSTVIDGPSVSDRGSCRGARFVWLALVVAFLPSRAAFAHPEGFSGMHVTISDNRVRAAITVHTRDLGGWFPTGIYTDYVADVTREMEETVDEIVELQIDGATQKILAVEAFLLEVGLIEIDVDYALPPTADPFEVLVWSKHLIRMPRGHQQLLFVEDRRQVSPETEQGLMRLDDVLSVERDAAAVVLPPVDADVSEETSQPFAAAGQGDESENKPPATTQPNVEPDQYHVTDAARLRKPRAAAATEHPTSRISFFFFGVEHIITGYDHLLFLAALLLACATFSEAATIITCFTIAHSVTLAMAAFDVVRLPGSVVEPLIALSIVYIAIENLSGKPGLWRRAAVTCSFGLIHGLGFASALRDIGLGTIPGGVVWPLLRFNLGVEAGQLCVAAVVLPVLLWAKRNERVSAALVPVGSVGVAIVGAYWLVTRVASEFVAG